MDLSTLSERAPIPVIQQGSRWSDLQAEEVGSYMVEVMDIRSIIPCEVPFRRCTFESRKLIALII
jgi:hypothetical protein